MNSLPPYKISPLTVLRRLFGMHRTSEGHHLVLDAADRQLDHVAKIASAARACDDQGLALLEKVGADGRVDPQEMSDFQNAVRQIRRSRDLDHQLSDCT